MRFCSPAPPYGAPGFLFAELVNGGNVVNWFNLSLVGWVIVIAAGAIAAYRFGVNPIWIAIGALLLLGIGIITSVKSSKPQV